ncbi:MAG: UDP-N-acetylmuramoyl-tripeptide--D-alanyl-D-alanine ligase [bacterium]
MFPLTVKEILLATNGILIQGDKKTVVSHISIDSRNIPNNAFFIAIKGNFFDGHDFILDVIKKGVLGIIVSNINKENIQAEIIIIKVKNTLKALQDIAHHIRKKIKCPIIAITGSNGKTTTKEMTASILESKYKTFKNKGNFNNHIGVPLSILEMNPFHEIGVFELGMSGIGEIKLLCKILKPTIGVVTNVGLAHLEFLKTIKNIAKAKSELPESLKEKNIIILNNDDKYVEAMKNKTKAFVMNFGLNNKAMVKAEKIINKKENGYEFVLKYKSKKIEIALPILGKHNILNALASASVGIALKVSLENIKNKLSQFQAPCYRMEVIKFKKITFLNDCYNANPSSMKEALLTLDNFDSKKRKIAILGDMLELGKKSKKFHEEIGNLVASLNIDIILTKGKEFYAITEKCFKKSKKQFFSFLENKQIVKKLKTILKSNDVVLIKGSRGMEMEEILEIYKK